MYRFKWPMKFSLSIGKFGKLLKTVGNIKLIRMIGKMSKRTLAFAAVLIMLLGVNSAFWLFRAMHQDINPGQEQTPKLGEWQVNLNENRLDEEQLKKEYSIPVPQKKPESAKKNLGQNGEISDGQSQNNTVKSQANTAVKDEDFSQKPSKTVDDTLEIKTAAAITQPSLTTMAMPAVGKVIADYAVDKLIYSKTLEQWNSHHGIDIAAEEGTPVKAVMDGTVVEVRSNDPRLGVVVVIDHGGDVRTLYGNLSSDKLVQKGKYVKKGQIIGAVGKTAPYEIEDPPHLHFEVFKGKENIDPQQYLPKLN